MRKDTRFRITPWQSARFRLKVLLLLVFSAICSIFLIGCNVDANIPRNQIVVAIPNDIKTFNPPLVRDAYSQIVLSRMFDGMVGENGVTAKLEPALAEKWEFQDSGKRVIFTLREGLKWSDGEPLTADDVLFTFKDVIFNEKIPTGNRDTLYIGKSKQLPKVEKLDNRRIVFTLPEPFAPLVRSAGGTPILPKHILAKTLDSPDSSKKGPKFLETWTANTPVNEIIGNGPYVIAEYRPSERIIYKRNPFYWKKGQPYIERFIYQIVDSSDTALIKFRSRELDVLGLRGQDYQLVKKAEKRDHFKIYNGGPATGQSFLMFNLNKGRGPDGKPFVDPVRSKWFNDVNFRRAVAYGIDRGTMITNFYRGLGVAQNSPITIASPYYLSPENGLKTYPYDPNKAKQILQAAGYKYDSGNKLLDAQGKLVRFTLLAPTGGSADQIGAQIKNDLAQIGITVDSIPTDFRNLGDKLDNSKQWDSCLLGFTGGVEPNEGINLWATDGDSHLFNKGPNPGEPPYAGREVASWEQEIHNLMIKGAQEIDEPKRKAVYAEYQKLVQEQLPLIHLVMPLSLGAVRDRVQNVKFSALGGALWNLDELKLTAE
jgi:peptide/nickel transport system substrate-binding protein